MQAIFFISLFSLMFLLVSGIVTGLSKSIMQMNVERVAEVKKMFNEIDLALNRVVFKEVQGSTLKKRVVDLSDPEITDLSGEFLTKYISFSKSQLEHDPWGNEVHLIRKVDHEQIWGGSGGQKVIAPVSYFLLVSAGPNERYDLFNYLSVDADFPNLSLNDIKTIDLTDKSIVRDDIIYRFSNYGAILDLWQQVEELDGTIKNIALDYYKNKIDSFSPLLQIAQRDISKEGILKDNIFADLSEDSGYKAFEDLKTQKELFTNEWYEDDPTNDNEIHDVLINNFRVAKKYNNEFVLSLDSDENKRLNKKFKDKYSNKEFLYPTFDVLIKDDSGNYLSNDKKGLQNLGVVGLKTLDPFTGREGAVDFSYDENEPAVIHIVRKLNDGLHSKEKWIILKDQKINALGGLDK